MNSTTAKIAGASFFAVSVTALALAGGTAANAAAQGAYADAYIGEQDTMLSVDAANGVFANDHCDNGAISLGSIANFVNGELDMHVDGSFDYTPAAGFVGQRTFDYELLCDGVSAGFTTAAIVFGPTVPVGQADFYTTPQDTTLTVPANGILANDGGALAAIDAKDLPDGLTPQFDGSFVYVPPVGFVGEVTWSYRMSNGSDTFSDWIPVTITVTPVVLSTPPVDLGTATTPDVPALDSELPTLAYTGSGDVSSWLLGPAMALLGLGGAAAFIARRRAQLS